MYDKIFKSLTLIFVLSSSLFGTNASALNLQLYKPHTGFRNGYVLFTTAGLPKKSLTLGCNIDYAESPFQVVQVTPTSEDVVNVVDALLTNDLNLGFAATSHIGLHITLPIHTYYNIPPLISPTRNEGNLATGDLRMAMQLQWIDPEANATQWGLAVVPFVSLPTGDADIYGGEADVTGGGIIALEKRFGNFAIYSNAGIELRTSEAFLTLDVDDQLLFGLGSQYLFSKENPFALTVELFGSTALAQPFAADDQIPLEVVSLIEKSWLTAHQNRLQIYAGAGLGLSEGGYGSPEYRLLTGLNFTFNLHKPRRVLHNTYYFAAGESTLPDSEKTKLGALAQYIKQKQIQKIEIIGYADYFGLDYQTNLKLSQDRATQLENSLQHEVNSTTQIQTDHEVLFELNTSPNLPMPEHRKVEIYFWE